MFSGSNSYLGGGNSSRPGQQQQYGQQQQQPSYLQPPGAFAAQPTGYGQMNQMQPQYTGMPTMSGGLQPQATGMRPGGLQPQPTGYPAQQPQATGYPAQQQSIQPQATGYPGQQQQSMYQQQSSPQPLMSQQTGYPPQPFQPQPTGYQSQQHTAFQPQQPQPTGFQSQQPPAQPQLPQPTGMTSSQMADSFRASSSSSRTRPQPPAQARSKIPSIRLSFITAQDQAKFEQLFKSAVGDDQALSGDKAKDLLLRSKLPGDSLSQIWMLSDTTKSGQLLFPEFALAMYLCNIKLTGKDLPAQLPERVRNEVSSMVDIISFGVAEDIAPPPAPSSNAPNFNEPPKIQQPQPTQPSNTQLMAQLTAQPTGYGFQSQPNGLQPQQTGFPSMQSQPTGYNGLRSPMNAGFGNQGLAPQQTGFGGQGLTPQQTGFPIAPLNAQPTGRPGQWGLVNAPSAGLPNLQALQNQMMPQAGREAGYSATGLRGNASVPWAITKDEKKIYDQMFKAWDGFGKGTISGAQAIEIFGQSGLDKPDLERIWTLSDSHNKGKLNLDEFAVAMHLIYRKLNGYPVPATLPPELIPPSTRNLNDSIGTMKSLLSQDAQQRKSSGAFLQPQKTGVSYLKSHSLRGEGNGSVNGRKDATVYKNNDDDVGYRSSARRRVQDNDRSSSPAESPAPSADEMNVEQLRKAIREKQILLDAMDFEDENSAEQEDALDRKDRKEADDLYRRIRHIQEDIDTHPNAGFKTGDSEAERRSMKRQLQGLNDRLPELASHVRRCERAIADAQIELFRLRDAKANPSSAPAVVGTGPGGAVTESDRLKARARAMMQARSAALTGKPAPATSGDDGAAAAKRLEDESNRVRIEREENERMVRDVEDSVTEFSKSLESSLKEGSEDASTEHARRRWDDGLGVEDEVRDFIFDLQRSSRSTRVRKEETGRSRDPVASAKADDAGRSSNGSGFESPARSETPRAASSNNAPSYASYKTAEERAAFVKQQAEQKMAERLAALGLRAPAKSGETPQQRVERERKEKEDRLRLAEEEDAKREEERQKRLADESIAPPTAASGAKKPAPPPARKGKPEASQESAEQAIRDQQAAQASETRELE